MIETPVKASPPSGPPSAPPPDARTRVMDPPPDPGARHVHACTECGLPLHEDQAACLSCGAMVDQGSGYAGIRRAAVGSATALLVLGSAVGAAVAGLPHGKHVGKPQLAHVFTPKKTIPPATADDTTTPGAGPTAKLPKAGTGSKPPAIAPETPHGTDSSGVPSAPSYSSGGGGGGTTSGGTGGAKAKTNGDDTSHKGSKHHDGHKHGSHKPGGPTLDPLGEAPAEASVFTADGPAGGSAYNAIDSDAKTAWSTGKSDRGIMVTPRSGSWNAIRVITDRPGWSLEIYYTQKDDPGGVHDGDWQQRGATNAEKANKFNVPDAKHYLVLVADPAGTARINEIELFQ